MAGVTGTPAGDGVRSGGRGRASRLRLAAGVAGPAAFGGSWAVLGARAEDYSPITDPISRLAAMGAPTRVVMTFGLTALGAGAALLADELRRRGAGPTWVSLGACGLATAAVAALPLGSPTDAPHTVAALVAYATLAGAPALAALRPPTSVPLPPRSVSAVVGALTAGLLAASTVAEPGGLLQRLGLSTGDAWMVAVAVRLWRRDGRRRGGRRQKGVGS